MGVEGRGTTRVRWRGMATLGVVMGGAAWLVTGCAHAPRGATAREHSTTPDSVTVGLWHMDETGGTQVADAGPFRLAGVAGSDTRTIFGREGNARAFSRSVNSFVVVPWSTALATDRALTVEAWINPDEYGNNEDTPIATRWTPQPGQQSWFLALLGRRTFAGAGSPGYHRDLPLVGERGLLMFAFQPADAGPPRAYFSTRAVVLDRWTHVAATYDGREVKLYIDGFLDADYASPGGIRASEAPLIVGNFLDPRQLSDFGGDLRAGPAMDTNPAYAFMGAIDELRISSTVRTRFEAFGR